MTFSWIRLVREARNAMHAPEAITSFVSAASHALIVDEVPSPLPFPAFPHFASSLPSLTLPLWAVRAPDAPFALDFTFPIAGSR